MKPQDLIQFDMVTLATGETGFVCDRHQHDEPFLIVNRIDNSFSSKPYIIRGFYTDDMVYGPNDNFSIVRVERLTPIDPEFPYMREYAKIWDKTDTDRCVIERNIQSINDELNPLLAERDELTRRIKQLQKKRSYEKQKLNNL